MAENLQTMISCCAHGGISRSITKAVRLTGTPATFAAAHRVGHDFVMHGLQAIRERKRFVAACLITLHLSRKETEMNTATPRTSERTSENLSSPPHTTYRKDVKTNERTPRASSTSHRAHEDSGNDRTPWNFLADIGRQQLAVATESTSAMYHGFENLRRIQQETAHQASVRHGEAAEKLFGPCQSSDVLSIQAELLRGDLQSAGQYWQQLMAGTMQMQSEMVASMSRMLDSEKGAGVKSALEVFQANIPALASSFFVTGSDRQSEQQHDS